MTPSVARLADCRHLGRAGTQEEDPDFVLGDLEPPGGFLAGEQRRKAHWGHDRDDIVNQIREPDLNEAHNRRAGR